MYRTLCHSKIHRATVTEANLNYQGSLTIDATLLLEADIKPFEKVHVVNINNGARFETYAITCAPDSGVICANGAAARLVSPGDLIIIISYALYSETELAAYAPRFVFVNPHNKIVKTHTDITNDPLIHEDLKA
jgi:aspartate 1-decarboxylase